MRFVPIHCIREGMLLGDNLYNDSGDLMLRRGEILTERYIGSITRLKYNGIYIEDDISKDLEVINIINDKVRADSVKAIKETFIFGEKGNEIGREHIDSAKKQVDLIVDEICGDKGLMVNMVDMKVFDDYTYYHSVNVAVLSIVLGLAMGLNRKDLCNLGFAAILHDIGKVFIDKELLTKQDYLSTMEFEEIKGHSLLGCNHIKKGYDVSIEAYMGILDHHERYGGGGYPNNLKGERISAFGRIIALADVYDALTSDRPYRSALLPSEAMEYIMGSSMTQFDPEFVDVFVRKIAPYPIGTCVKLSNGLTGIVVENYEHLCLRPKIRIFKDHENKIEPYEIQLSDHESLNITVIEVV